MYRSSLDLKSNVLVYEKGSVENSEKSLPNIKLISNFIQLFIKYLYAKDTFWIVFVK